MSAVQRTALSPLLLLCSPAPARLSFLHFSFLQFQALGYLRDFAYALSLSGTLCLMLLPLSPVHLSDLCLTVTSSGMHSLVTPAPHW